MWSMSSITTGSSRSSNQFTPLYRPGRRGGGTGQGDDEEERRLGLPQARGTGRSSPPCGRADSLQRSNRGWEEGLRAAQVGSGAGGRRSPAVSTAAADGGEDDRLVQPQAKEEEAEEGGLAGDLKLEGCFCKIRNQLGRGHPFQYKITVLPTISR